MMFNVRFFATWVAPYPDPDDAVYGEDDIVYMHRSDHATLDEAYHALADAVRRRQGREFLARTAAEPDLPALEEFDDHHVGLWSHHDFARQATFTVERYVVAV